MIASVDCSAGDACEALPTARERESASTVFRAAATEGKSMAQQYVRTIIERFNLKGTSEFKTVECNMRNGNLRVVSEPQ